MKIRSYKFRIYPTAAQEILFTKTFGCVRFVYNKALEIKSIAYKVEKKNISIFDIDKQMSEWKKTNEFSWLREVNAQSLQSSLRNLDCAYTSFFKQKTKFPKFKSKYGKQSFSNVQQTKVDFDSQKLFIPKFQEGIKTIFHRQFTGKIKTSTITKTPTGKYFVSIVVEESGAEALLVKAVESECIGIDLGLKNYVTLSDGTKVENPKYLKKKLKRLRRLSRKHSKTKKGSKNRDKARQKLAKIHEKVANTRLDFLHKLTSGLVKNHDHNCFAIENLNIPEMAKTKWLARNIHDAAWGTFTTFLEYKALRVGKQVLTIGRFEPSSKMCSCGKINTDLRLKDRFWTCSCGSVNDRDILAAQNIKRFAFCKQNTYNDTVGRESPKPSRKGTTSPEISNRKSKKEKIKRESVK